MAERTSKGNKSTPPTPEGFVPAGDPGPEDQLQEQRLQAERDQVEVSGLEAAPEDQRGPTGGSFVNPATVGSGTILPNGTYGAPLPDPSVAKLAEAERDAKDRDSQ